MSRTEIAELSAVQHPAKMFCMQCQKFVEASKITYWHTGKMRRRVCESCKSKNIERRKPA